MPVKQYFALLLLCIASLYAYPQQSNMLCGTTPASLKSLQEKLLQNKNLLKNFPVQPRNMQYIPVRFHLVAKDDGTGAVRHRNLLDQLCMLNEDFLSANIQFYLQGDLNIVENTAIFEDHYHNAIKMEQMRDDEAVNIWIVDALYSPNPNAVSAGAYQISYDWLIIRKSEINSSAVTLTHEMGHFFSLLHLFHGWDMEPWRADVHGNPAPSMSPMNVPTERQDGSNCESSGDYICDTPPDYNFGYYWTFDCEYAGGARDPMGTTVDPDEANFMTYFDRCERSAYHFSAEQKYVMHADMMSNSRQYIRSGYTPLYMQINEPASLELPFPGETVPYFNSVQLDWSAVDGATHYLVELDLVPTFSFQLQSFIATENQLEIKTLDPNRTYYWRVRPFNEYFTCTENSTSSTFKTTAIATSVHNIRQLSDWKVNPNPVSRNSGLEIAFNTSKSFRGSFMLFDPTGVIVVKTTEQRFEIGQNSLSISTKGLMQGIYFLAFQTEKDILTKKIIVQ